MLSSSALFKRSASQLGRRTILNQKKFYSDMVKDHFYNPKNVGTLPSSEDTGVAMVGKASCGDMIKMHIKVNKDTKVIEDVKYKVFGCGSAVASSSYASELVRGMTVDQALNISNKDLAGKQL